MSSLDPVTALARHKRMIGLNLAARATAIGARPGASLVIAERCDAYAQELLERHGPVPPEWWERRVRTHAEQLARKAAGEPFGFDPHDLAEVSAVERGEWRQ